MPNLEIKKLGTRLYAKVKQFGITKRIVVTNQSYPGDLVT